jgi:hypothetical protein
LAKRKPGQLPLAADDAPAAGKKGSVERAAERDLTSMRKGKQISEAVGALEAAYRLTAREVDRSEVEQDRYGKLNAVRELRALREKLGPMTAPTSSSEADEFWSNMGEPVPGADA